MLSKAGGEQGLSPGETGPEMGMFFWTREDAEAEAASMRERGHTNATVEEDIGGWMVVW